MLLPGSRVTMDCYNSLQSSSWTQISLCRATSSRAAVVSSTRQRAIHLASPFFFEIAPGHSRGASLAWLSQRLDDERENEVPPSRSRLDLGLSSARSRPLLMLALAILSKDLVANATTPRPSHPLSTVRPLHPTPCHTTPRSYHYKAMSPPGHACPGLFRASSSFPS